MRIHPLAAVLTAFVLTILLAAPTEAAKARKHSSPATVMADAGRLQQAPNSVWYGAEYLGTDPDPRIRHELLRDLTAHFGGNF